MAPTKKELILASLVMLLIPVVGEILLRIGGVQFDAQFYKPDRELGWTLRPGAMGLLSTETSQFVEINSHGFRDEERSYEKPSNTLRIAVLGNSWTEAMQVPLDKTYCSVLQKKLEEMGCFGEKRVQVLNFGVAGYSTAQELLTLQQRVWEYHPDVVLLALYPARDIANNVRELNNAANPERSPYFVYRGEQLVLDDSFRDVPELQPRQIEMQTLTYQLNRRIRVLQAVNALQRFGILHISMASAKRKAERSGIGNLEYGIYEPPKASAMQAAWELTQGMLMVMREEVRQHGAEFRIVILATRPQVIPEPEKRAQLAKRLGVHDLSYADERIEKFGERLGIPVTRLAPPLAAYAERSGVFLNGFNRSNFGSGHWNETGHRLAAEVIAGDICKTNLGRNMKDLNGKR